MADMENSADLEPSFRRTVRSNRPDLVDQDFRALDLERVDHYRKVLDGEKAFCGQANGQITPDMVEENKIAFAQGHMSYVHSARVCGQWFASKKSWISVEDDHKRYDKEIKSLQALRKLHWHVVLLMAHYLSAECINEGRLLLCPLAECTLEHYISQKPTPGRRRVVMRWFGCLAGGLDNIHQQNIKHKDIKTENILVHGENIIITDLGISNTFSENSSSYGDSPGWFRYMAPEVHANSRRGRQQDVWSLICCFIEMFSFCRGTTIPEFRRWCNPNEWIFIFCVDYDKVVDWLNRFRTQEEMEADLGLLDLLIDGFKKDQTERPSAGDLFNRLRDMGTFIGDCCAQPRRHNESGSLSLSADPQRLERSQLLHFVIGAGRRIGRQLNFPSVRTVVGELLQNVKRDQIRSFRSAERALLFDIAVRKCGSAKEYLSFCNAFIEELSAAVNCEDYVTCIYDEQAGEHERPYTTAYFAVLVEVVLSRCRTNRWTDERNP